MQTLRQCLEEAAGRKRALGHFNAANMEMILAIFRAARAAGAPVIVGFSEGERDFIGVRQAAAIIKSIRDEYSYPIFCNADHTYSFDRVKEAIDAGFDAVIFDGAELPFEENLKVAKQCVQYARDSRCGVLVEGELGFIGKSSNVLESLPPGVVLDKSHLTSPAEAARFVKETGVDLLAPAVGNVHGMLSSGREPALDIERVKDIREAAGVPLVLHGASGNSPEDIKAAVAAGAAIVHVSTELRVVYRKTLVLSLQENPDEVAPYKFLKEPMKAVEKVVGEKLKILNF